MVADMLHFYMLRFRLSPFFLGATKHARLWHVVPMSLGLYQGNGFLLCYRMARVVVASNKADVTVQNCSLIMGENV
jgi:hypothetical protein